MRNTHPNKEKFLKDLREVLRNNNATSLRINVEEVPDFDGSHGPYNRKTIVVSFKDENGFHNWVELGDNINV